MAEPIKSVLLVDYESLQRSLVGTVGENRLAERSAVWLAALEAGRLGPDVKRKLLVKRCYVNPSVRGKPRDLLIAAGFDLVDALDAGARSSADLHMAMDTIDALGKPDGYQEFILLSAAAELAPLLSRLKANKRVTVIYGEPATPAGDRQLTDAIIETADLVRILTGEPTPVSDISAPAGASNPRADIEAFARRIHSATSVPLFSPKTFAELFRQLTEEIAANGYHFQTTARNVADRMVASGRNVTRRQVVFIVKGLALKGHVFSTNDNAEKLAEVFREQAHYLITNAGITLNRHEEDLLTAWFLSRPPSQPAVAPVPAAAMPAAGTPAATTQAPAPSPPASPTAESEPLEEAKATIAETIEREVAKAVARPPGPERVAIKPPQPQAQPPRGAPQMQKPPQVKPVDMPKSTAKPQPFPSAREEAKAVIAARIAGAARMKPAGSRTPIPAKPAPKAPASPASDTETGATPTAESAPRPSEAEGAKTEALENSILAAIAEAVDVLVEDSNGENAAPPPRELQGKKRTNSRATPPEPPRQPEPEPPPPPEPEEEDTAESNDIGDQIQRIIASYNRNRSDE